MQETIVLLHNILLYSVICLALCAFIGVVISLKSKEHKVFKRRLSLLNPTYYLFFSVITFSFMITLILKRHFVLIDAFFAAFLIFILFNGIKVYKFVKNEKTFENSISFATKKYCFDMLLCVAFYIFIITDII
ncbi:MAG: hypothetical protein LBJ88_04915 [Campylobacteraceae bacterium]|jgi:hypothetical protein|nr:hypothetical protein [Campylobacteraceae bacterium]